MSDTTHNSRCPSILLVEDNPHDVELCLRALKKGGIDARAQVVQTAQEFRAILKAQEFHLVLVDNTLPSWSGREALELLHQMEKDIPLILLTGTLRDEQAAEFLDKGAVNYVHKDRMNRLPAAVRRALDGGTARKRRTDLERRLRESEERAANLQAQLRQTQRLETVGKLASGVAHDFSNILTIIQGHAELLGAEPNTNPGTQESLQQMLRATERAGKLAKQLLALGRNTAPNRRALDLNEMLADMSTLLHRTIGEDIEFEFNYDPNLPPVYGDLHSIEQCVLSIAVHAREAMPSGGQLLMSTSTVEIDASHVAYHPEAREGRFVCLAFVDSSEGTNEQATSRLFAAPTTTEPRHGNFEVGMVAIKDIAREHQGWTEVQSTGHGTTLRIYLPIHMGTDAATKTTARRTQAVGRETVLVVEDEAPVRSIIRTMLERGGFEVLDAGSGIEALAIWHQHHNDIKLLLTDMVMPAGLSGQELADKFRSQKPDLKVLYTSGYSPRAAGNGSSLENGTAFLQKPFDGKELAEAVGRCLDGHQ